jgi:hypothetical protein
MPTKEHVVQESLGGNLTLDEEVCGVCNTDIFTPMDHELCNFIRLYYHDHPDLKQDAFSYILGRHSVYYDETKSIYVSVRLDRKYVPRHLPQLVFLDDDLNVVQWIMDDDENINIQKTVTTFFKELNTTSKKIKTLIFAQDDQKPKMQPAIIRSGKGAFAVRAQDDEMADKVHKFIASGKLTFGDELLKDHNKDSSNVRMQGRAKVNVGYISRALAKSALEFYCVFEGHHKTINHIFDSIRNYINTGNSDLSQHVTVIANDKDINHLSMFKKRDCHTVFMTLSNGIYQVYFFYYQKLFSIVRLNNDPVATSGELSHCVGLFNYKLNSHKLYSLRQNPNEFAKQFLM